MAFEDGSKKELQKVGIKISNNFPLSGTSLASLESLSLPLVQEVVLSADMQCDKCQKRVTDIITKMNGKHVCVPSSETESVEVDVLEKKVILTFRIPTVGKVIQQQTSPINTNRTPLPKVAIIKRIFRSSRR
ncbi:Heavy metal-associated domain superfamily [Sesbania bispinosa]|nr:Heavy metal-associated domain superfamily [Sesbania bispinosa]